MQAAGLGRSGPAGKRPLRASRDTLDAPDASGACKKRHGRAVTPVRGSGGKTGDMPEKGANGPGRTAGRPRKTAAPPEKPAKPPPAPAAGGRACNRRAGGPEGPRAAPPAAPETGPETARAGPPARGERTGSDRPRPACPDAGAAPCMGRCKKNGRRRWEKTEMPEQGRKDGERAGPCARRYSCQAASVNVRAGEAPRSEHPSPLVEREVGVTRMEPRSQRWLKTSTISRPRRESCRCRLSSRLSSRASISSWTRAAAVVTPRRHSPLAAGQSQPQGGVGLAGAAGAYGDDVVPARGEPLGRNTPCAPPVQA